MSNLDLWDSVKETDVTQIKQVKQRGGYTSIRPQYQLQEATRVFGSYGKGFGFKSVDMDLSLTSTLGVVVVNAVFFYISDGEKHEFPITNSWPSKMGERVDPDFIKKAETNTLGKALSKLGFNADIYMGQFEDPNYVDYIAYEQSINKAEDKDQEIKKKIEELNEWCRKESACYSAVKNKNTIDLMLAGHKQKLNDRCRLLNLDFNAYAKGFDKAYNEQLNVINGDNK